jgi:hypothetical protein
MDDARLHNISISADDLAKAIVVAIAKGQVPAVKIEY